MSKISVTTKRFVKRWNVALDPDNAYRFTRATKRLIDTETSRLRAQLLKAREAMEAVRKDVVDSQRYRAIEKLDRAIKGTRND